MFMSRKKPEMPTAATALKGRAEPIPTASEHFVLKGRSLKGPWPAGLETAMFGMGCFWGAEKKFWELAGVYTTAVGYAAGDTPNPTYREVCTGMTGHTEVVLVVFDPKAISLRRSAEECSGRATIRRRACARATTSARSIAPASTTTTRAAARRRSVARRFREGAVGRRLRRDHHRDPRRRRSSTTPRTTTSSISRRIRTAIAASAGPA